MFEGFVVTGEPLLGSDHAAVDVVAHQAFGTLGSVPLNEHGRLCVPGGNNLTGSRGDACSEERESSFNTSNDIVIKQLTIMG